LAAGSDPHCRFYGHVAEWLRNGLQNRVPRFNSGRGLHFNLLVPAPAPLIRAKRETALSKPDRLCYTRRAHLKLLLFPGSSVVEQPAVNRLVAGSNPARGATSTDPPDPRGRSYRRCQTAKPEICFTRTKTILPPRKSGGMRPQAEHARLPAKRKIRRGINLPRANHAQASSQCRHCES
jgi:hypothetical protein